MTNAKMLQSRQTVARSRLVDERSIPTIDKTNGIAELVSRIPNRNLSIFDHSCTERLRNATTTPANPPASRPLEHLRLALHSVAYLNKIRFDSLANKFGINIQAVAHRGATVENLRLGSVGQEETK